jgi:hypothetical protein
MSKTPDSHDMFKRRKGEGNSLLWGLQSSKIIFESLNILKIQRNSGKLTIIIVF